MIARSYNILNLLAKDFSVLVLGPRGTGKSYYVNSLLDSSFTNSSIRINLLSTTDFSTYLTDPSLLTKQVRARVAQGVGGKLCVFIDEVQLVPQLLNEVHLLIEELKNKVVFILTGSSARKLKREKANLLAARALFISFYPISHLEFDIDLNLDKALRFGTLPRVLLETDLEVIELYLKTYSLSYLKEEIQQEALVRNLPAFSRFLELSAQYNGKHINYSKLAKTIGVSANTVTGYFSILEETLLLTRVPAWSNSVRIQLQQSPKYYFFDNGVLRALCGELRSELNERSFRYGVMFENLVINEIIKYIAIKRTEHKLYSFRTRSQQEIDLVLQRGPFEPPIGIEIKSDVSPKAKDVQSLRYLREENKEARLLVLCRTNEPYVDEEIEFWPYITGIGQALK